MIKFIAINYTGMFGYITSPVIFLDNLGTVFIKGPNGSGKSSFLNSIKEICYGKNDTGKSGINVINKHQDWNNGFFGAIWLYDHNDIFWRIFSIRKWKGAPPFDLNLPNLGGPSDILNLKQKYTGSDVFLERWDGSVWKDERATSIKDKKFKDTQHKIIEVVMDMTYNQFSAYVCLGQKAESALVNGSSNEREKIIQAVADVSIWDNAATVIKNTTALKELELLTANNKIKGIQSVINQLSLPSEDEIVATKQAINDSQTTLNNIEQKLKDYNIQSAELNKKINESDRSKLEKELKDIKEKERQAVEILQNTQAPSKSDELVALEESVIKYSGIHEELIKDIKNYDTMQAGECSRCGQEVTKEHLKTEIELLVKESTELQTNITIKKKEATELSNKYDEEVKQASALAKQEYENKLKICADSESYILDQLKKSDKFQNDLGIINTNIESINQRKFQQIQYIGALNDKLNGFNNKKLEYEAAQQQLTNAQEESNNIQVLISHNKWVERNLKRMKLQEYESALTRLNTLLATTLHNLWGGGLMARFVTAQEKSRGKGIKQGLELIVYTPNKEGVPIEMYSGGQTKSIIVSMFRAARQFIQERGGGVNISGIDEIDKDLDDDKTDRLVNALESVVEDSPTCFVISHNTRLLNTMQFDRIWTVHYENEISSIELDSPTTYQAIPQVA